MRTARAATLLEVLLAAALLAALAGPLWDLATTSRKLYVSARDRSQAAALASSYLAALRCLPARAIPPLDDALDRELTGGLALERLDVEPCPQGFRRLLSAQPLPLTSVAGPWTHLQVTVAWRSPVTHDDLAFRLDAVVR